MTRNDQLMAALGAAAIVMFDCFAAMILLVLQLIRSLSSRDSANARGLQRLAIAWWVVCVIGLFAGLFLIAQEPLARNLLILFGGVGFAGAMGWLAGWTGKQFARSADPAVPSGQRLPRILNLVVVGILVAAAIIYWLIYENRLHSAKEAEEQARQRQRIEQADLEERSREMSYAIDCRSLAYELNSLARHDLRHDGFPEDTHIPEFHNPEADALVQRLARGKLVAQDIGPQNPAFPCLDKQRKAILDAYSRGLAYLEIWTLDTEVSPLAQEALTQSFHVPASTRMLMRHLDGLALVAAQNKRPDEMARATKLCGLAKAIQDASIEAPELFHPEGCLQLASLSPK